jgi:hypothetical protein
VTVSAAPAASTAPATTTASDVKAKPVETVAAKTTPAPKKSAAAASDLRVRKLVVARGVDNREPVGASESFKKGEFEKIYAYLEVDSPDDGEIVVSFEPPSAKAAKGNVTLEVGRSPRWRTWAFSRGINETGRWAAVARSSDGRELAREEFDVTL